MSYRQALLRHRARRAFTLVEVMIASLLLVVLMTGAMMVFIELLRLEQSNSRQLSMTRDVSDLSRELRQIAAARGQVTDQDTFVTGTPPQTPTSVVPHSEVRAFITWTSAVGAATRTSELLIRDIDGDPTTIGDNSLVLVRDIANPGATRILRYVSPLETTGTVNWAAAFGRPTPPSGTQFLNAPLEVRLRFGDRVFIRDRAGRRNNDDARAEDAFTGPSFESIVLNTVYATRVRQS